MSRHSSDEKQNRYPTGKSEQLLYKGKESSRPPQAAKIASRPPPGGFPPPQAAPHQQAAIKWRCRRGMKELDMLLENYLDKHYSNASAVEQQAFADLVELPDPDLFAYLMGRAKPEPGELELISVIRKIAAINS